MQTDIEIYLLSCPTDKIISWLEGEFNVIEKKQPTAVCTKLTFEYQQADIKVTILEQAAGKRFTSVWFDSDKTPWEDDMACARQAFSSLNCEVRCNYQGWEEAGEQDPDQWWRINQQGEGPFIWT
ncbi:hypothetical protein [Marinomonas posidonica]|uniref:Uncharacterized protein n=1 Tax=Marinomonas posidonica (strain CECT 7376 / NCIMB 14433 / IVIA-Po-181) TaxID=491952 RepID=F6CY38_MARPP|nr:hypothetical protein [Marinomonas posidonica]AEF55670.1 hypothetical protein Mar181_2639 [Marinomonas posidonica IVIA-Po-181]